jgi:hypothetical protein
LVRAWPANFQAAFRLVGDEEHRVAVLGAGQRLEPGSRSSATNLAIGPCPPRLEHDVAQARLALALRPAVQLVEEAARLARRMRRADRPHHAALGDDAGEDLEVGAGEHLADVEMRSGLRRSGLSVP